MSANYYFEGVVTALEPLTVQNSTTGKGNLPRNGGPDDAAYFPSSSIRGVLRHSCEQEVAKFLEKTTGKKLTLEQHFALAQGVDIRKKSPDGDDELVSVFSDIKLGVVDASAVLRKTNPFMSLFGRWGLSSRLCVGNMYPKSSNSVAIFNKAYRGVMFDRTPEKKEWLSEADQQRLSELLYEQADVSEKSGVIKAQKTALIRQLSSANADEKERIKKQLNDLENELKELKQNKKGSENAIRMPIDGCEAFVRGCEFSHNISVLAATDTELSLLLTALRVFSKSPYLGGKRASNNGLVEMKYTIYRLGEQDDIRVNVGSVHIGPNGFIVEGSVKELIDMWKSEHLDFTAF